MESSGLVKRSNGHLGVTEPISWSGPTEYDVIRTQELDKVEFLNHTRAFLFCSNLFLKWMGYCNLPFLSISILQMLGCMKARKKLFPGKRFWEDWTRLEICDFISCYSFTLFASFCWTSWYANFDRLWKYGSRKLAGPRDSMSSLSKKQMPRYLLLVLTDSGYFCSTFFAHW